MNKTSKVMFLSFFVNAFLSIFKILIGFIGKSTALIADGIHSSSDLLTDVVAIVANIFSLKPADREHPYGHGRIEYLTSILIGIIIIIIAFVLIYETEKNKINIPSKIVIIVSIITILTKYLLSEYLIIKGKKYDNQILTSSGKESRTDVYSSVVVLLSSILMQFQNKIEYLKYSDKIASIIVALFIIKAGFEIIKENINILIGKQEDKTEYYDEVKNKILNNKYIKNIDKLIIMKYGYYYSLTIEVSMDKNMSVEKSHDELEKIENILKENERTKYINIHINPADN